MTILVDIESAPMNLSESWAPSNATLACAATSRVMGPSDPSAHQRSPANREYPEEPEEDRRLREDRRHEENGLVPRSGTAHRLLSFVATRDRSFPCIRLIFCNSGEIICILRDEWICLTKSGISRARMTITSPTIENAQVKPDSSGIPIAAKPEWKPYMIQATTHSIG